MFNRKKNGRTDMVPAASYEIEEPDGEDINQRSLVFENGYDADPTEAFAKHFEKLGHGIGPAEEMLKTGQDTIELIVRSRTKTENIGSMITLLLKADCDEMIAEHGKLSRAIYSRMAGVYALAFSIGENGGARREFVEISSAYERSNRAKEGERRRGWGSRF